MSPLALRRYRAERLLHRDFHAQRPAVLAQARHRLRPLGVRLDEGELEACYGQAWQGLYATVLSGEPVASPMGWLVTVTVRRAIDEHRRRDRRPAVSVESLPGRAGAIAACQPDPGERLDDLDRLREVFEALRGRLSPRERQAANLCYVQGLSRAEAAQRMGLSRRRLDKLMDGLGADAPGVAAKVRELLAVIRGDRWCEEQASLMRGLAFGLLDPAGERYRLAVVHQRECPACRAYVASLRGLAAVLPPLSIPVRAAGLGASAAAGANGAAAAGGASAAGGGWWLFGGSLGVKVAAGCLIALGLGAGCVALGHREHASRPPAAVAHVHRRRARDGGSRAPARLTFAPVAAPVAGVVVRRSVATARTAVAEAAARASSASGARREFGIESLAAPAPLTTAAVARASSARVPATAPAPSAPAVQTSAGQAQREFGVQ